MPSPQRRLITSNVKTVLAAINGSPTYRSTVVTVDTIIRHWDEVAVSLRPWIGVVPGIERYEFLAGGLIKVTLPFELLAYVTGSSQSDMLDKVNNLHDDILVALLADQSRGGNATMTTFTEFETNEAEEGVEGVLRLKFEVVYFRTTTAS